MKLEVTSGPDALTMAALWRVEALAGAAVRERGCFRLALSGGSTPAGLYRALASPEEAPRLFWPSIELYFGDERCVPPDHPESNFGMVKRTLLDAVPVPPSQVHRIQGELPPPEAAAAYEQELYQCFRLGAGAVPRFDLILLGLGPDGHTASLFPHTSALRVQDRLAVANEVPQLQTTRITLTAPVLNEARTILFLVAGADKAGAAQSVLEGPRDPERFPAQIIRPRDGEVTWLVDRSAAALLDPSNYGVSTHLA